MQVVETKRSRICSRTIEAAGMLGIGIEIGVMNVRGPRVCRIRFTVLNPMGGVVESGENVDRLPGKRTKKNLL